MFLHLRGLENAQASRIEEGRFHWEDLWEDSMVFLADGSLKMGFPSDFLGFFWTSLDADFGI